jgi:hypothetical protein
MHTDFGPWLVADFSLSGHRRKTRDAVLLALPPGGHAVYPAPGAGGDWNRRSLFMQVLAWQRRTAARGVVFTTGDPMLCLNAPLSLFFPRRVYIVCRLGRFCTSALTWPLRRFMRATLVVVNPALRSEVERCFPSARVLVLPDPINPGLEAYRQTAGVPSGDPSRVRIACMGGSYTERGLDPLMAGLDVAGWQLAGRPVELTLINVGQLPAVLPAAVKVERRDLRSDAEFYRAMHDCDIFWALKSPGGEYFSSTAIEALALERRVLIHHSTWSDQISAVAPALVSVAQLSADQIQRALMQAQAVTPAQCALSARTVFSAYSQSHFISAMRSLIEDVADASSGAG